MKELPKNGHYSTIARQQYLKLEKDEKLAFVSEFSRERKDTTTGFLLAFFFGFHYIYLRKFGWQIVYWLTAGGFLIWWLIDLFRVGAMVKAQNQNLSTKIMKDLAVLRRA